MSIDWFAVDWGTTNVRAWAMAGDRVLGERRSDRGMGSLARADFEPALLSLIGDWAGDRIEAVVCGMAGARQGWLEAPYLSVPARPLEPARAVRPETEDPRLDVAIMPGLSQADPPDVMRGEETQIAGLLHRTPDFDGVVCLPGTHTKWAHVSAGEVVSFRTAMTGEMFDLLSRQSVLRHSVGPGWDADAFTAAVDETYARPHRLAAALFGIRAEGLLGPADGGRSRARLSGLLLGAELAAMKPYWLGRRVAVVGASGLAETYVAALGSLGLEAEVSAGTDAVLDGLRAARGALGRVPA